MAVVLVKNSSFELSDRLLMKTNLVNWRSFEFELHLLVSEDIEKVLKHLETHDCNLTIVLAKFKCELIKLACLVLNNAFSIFACKLIRRLVLFSIFNYKSPTV